MNEPTSWAVIVSTFIICLYTYLSIDSHYETKIRLKGLEQGCNVSNILVIECFEKD